jgi:hypothetical protein
MSEARAIVPGVAVEAFNEPVWQGIATAYVRSAYSLPESEPVSSRRWYDISAATILADRESHGFWGEFRLGSLITMHSKLRFCDFTPGVFHFNFDPNASSGELKFAKRNGITPENIQIELDRQIAEFLGKQGVMQEVTDCLDLRYR